MKVGDNIKKKIITSVFLLLIVITAIIFIVGSIYTYNYEVANNDFMVGFGSGLTLLVGSFVVFYELDLFYTVYCFFIKPKNATKSIFNILSNLTLLSIVFTDSMAHFLYKYVSKIFGEEIIVFFALLCLYIVLRLVCAMVSYGQAANEK